jgi:hypothetical protein
MAKTKREIAASIRQMSFQLSQKERSLGLMLQARKLEFDAAALEAQAVVLSLK